MNIGVKENTVQFLFIGALVVLVGVVSFFKWPAEVTGATAITPPCVVPADGLILERTAKLCAGTYVLPDGISVGGDGLTLDCNNAVLVGEGRGTGILVEGNGNTVEDCTLKGYTTGVKDLGSGNQMVRVVVSSSS